MPARKRAGKRLRAARSAAGKPTATELVAKRRAARKPAAKRLMSLVLDLEVPLNEATDAVHALRLMGYGLEGQGHRHEGRAIADVAWTACQRLDALDEAWRSLCDAARGNDYF